jgi:hypothetical protein
MKLGPARGVSAVPVGLLQRKCACGGSAGLAGECAECGKKRLTMQRKPASQAEPSAAPPVVHEALRSPGQPLDAATRAFFEPRFGHDFGQVRVHTDAKAVESARATNALAYTVGRDVVFDSGHYAPHSADGRRLLAHELTHVAQQRSAGAAAQASGESANLTVSPADHDAERQADAAADAALSGVKPEIAPNGGQQLQRAPRETRERAEMGLPKGHGGTLPYREATELLKCIQIMGEANAEYCRQEVLGEQPIRPTAGCGWFAVNMKPFTTGVEGTIEFYPDAKICPKCGLIRLVQIVRVFEKPGEEYKWSGKEGPREKVKTDEDKKKGVKAGYFVDHKAENCSKGKGCSLYYREHWTNAAISQDGSNDGATAVKASLWDRPFGDANDVFEFETCARCHDSGDYLGCVDWGFTADNAGAVTATSPFEYAAPSATFNAAIAKFNKYYANK